MKYCCPNLFTELLKKLENFELYKIYLGDNKHKTIEIAPPNLLDLSNMSTKLGSILRPVLIISVLYCSGCSHPSQKDLSKGSSTSQGTSSNGTSSPTTGITPSEDIGPAGGVSVGSGTNPDTPDQSNPDTPTTGENGGAVISGPTFYGVDVLNIDQFVVNGALSQTLLKDALDSFRSSGFNVISMGISADNTSTLFSLLQVAATAEMQLILWLNDSCPERDHASTPWCFSSNVANPAFADPVLGWDISRGAAAMSIIDAHNANRPAKPTVLAVVATHEPFHSANIQDVTDNLSTEDPVIYEKIASRVAGLYERLTTTYPNTQVAVFFTAIAGRNGTETAPYLDYWIDAAGSTPASGGTPLGRRMADIAITFQHCDQDATAIAADETTFRGGCETVAKNNKIDRSFLNRYENLKDMKLFFNLQAFGSKCYHKAMPTIATLANRACTWSADIDGLMYYSWNDPTVGTPADEFPIDILTEEQCKPSLDPDDPSGGSIPGVYEETLSSLAGDMPKLAYDVVFSTDTCTLP